MKRKITRHDCGLDSKLDKVKTPWENALAALYRCDKCGKTYLGTYSLG